MICLLLHLFGHGRAGHPVASGVERGGSNAPAQDVLARRYAAGEIGRDEYLALRHALDLPWTDRSGASRWSRAQRSP